MPKYEDQGLSKVGRGGAIGTKAAGSHERDDTMHARYRTEGHDCFLMEVCVHIKCTGQRPSQLFLRWCQRVMATSRERTVLITVGSTRFDALINAALSPATLNALRACWGPGACMYLQYGQSPVSWPVDAVTHIHMGVNGHAFSMEGVNVFAFAYAPHLRTWIEAASLVLSHGGMYVRHLHAGAGTILEVTRSTPTPRLIVIPNTNLMHDHQRELAEHLAAQHVLSLGDVSYVCLSAHCTASCQK